MGSFATRFPKEIGFMARETTPFVLHSALTNDRGLVIDYTEKRLQRLIACAVQSDIKSTLENMLVDYKAGTIAVAWHHGTACMVPVKKEK